MDIKIRYRFDGGQTCQPIGAGVDSIATPVQIPIATDATVRVEIVSAWSRRIVRPNVDISGATAWRFAIFNSYGDGSGMLFATRNVDHAGAGWSFSWRESGTSELYNALGTESARVFRAELQGYASQTSALPVAVFSFPFRVGNRRGDIVAISPIEQFEESDPVAMAALDAHATAGNAHADIREAVTAAEHSATKAGTDLAAHTSRTDNPHAVTEAQLVEASGTQAKSGKYLRVFDDDSSTGAYSNEKLTFFGKTIFRGETECGETKAGAIEVTGGAIVHTVLAVFGGSFYLEDLENPGSMYEMSVRGGKLYFNNNPISSDSVLSMKA